MNVMFVIGALVCGGAIFYFAYWAGINISFRRMNPVDRAELIRRISMKTDRGSLRDRGVGVIRAFVGFRGSTQVLAYSWALAFAGTYTLALALRWGYLGALALAIPASMLVLIMMVRRSAKTQRTRFERQLMTAMPLVAGQLEAGAGIKRALERVVEVIEDPLRGEIAVVLNKVEAGLSIVEAIRELEEKYPIAAMRLFVAALEANADSGGGQLAPVLRAISEGLERAFELRAEAQAEISQSKYQFYGILAGLGLITFLMYNMGGAETKQAYTSFLGLVVMIPILLNALWGVLRVRKFFNQAERGEA